MNVTDPPGPRRRVKAATFAAAVRVLTEWATRRPTEDKMTTGDTRPYKVPSARTVISNGDFRSKTVADTIAVAYSGVPALVIARDLVGRFHGMIQRRGTAVIGGRRARM